MTTSKSLLMTSALSAALLCPATADAFEFFEVGLGIIGQAGANFLDEPSDQTVQGQAVTPNYPGFVGLSTGFGGFIDFRVAKFVGVEVDVIHAGHRGSADFTVTNQTTGEQQVFDVEIENSALHFPILFKGVLPGAIVSPSLFVGPEFVLPSKPALTMTPPAGNASSVQFGVVEDLPNYTLLTFGLGVEFSLPIPVDVLQVRIPLTLRGSIDPASANTREERSSIYDVTTDANGRVTGYREDYKTKWQFQTYATLGASVHF